MTEVTVELLAPGVAVAFVVAVIKAAVPGLSARMYPLLALAGGLLYAVTAAATGELLVGDSPVAVVLLGVSVGLEASGLQGWLRTSDKASALADRLPGTR